MEAWLTHNLADITGARPPSKAEQHFFEEAGKQFHSRSTREREHCGGPPATTATRVSVALSELAKGRIPKLREVASDLHLSRRSLQRRLTDEGTSFSRLVDAHCRLLALEALAMQALTNEEVAAQCGYEETRSFYRAFSRWTGMTPSRYRSR